jgi:hypothetical protein
MFFYFSMSGNSFTDSGERIFIPVVMCPVTNKNNPFPQEQPNQIGLFHILQSCHLVSDVAVELSAGVFLGSDEGLFGQFRDNSFVKTGITYPF